MAKVDVIVPCYRYGRFLRTCVDSVLTQSMRDVRVLIIDDASPDDFREVALRLSRDDPRVTVICHARNRGHIATYNEGIAWAASDYLLLLSADDLLAPGALARAAPVLDAYPEVVLAYGRCLDWRDSQPLPALPQESGAGWELRRGIDFVRETCASGINLIPTPTAIVRTAVQKRVGGYNPKLPHSGDMEMWLRLAANGDVARIDAVQAVRREHSANMSASYYADICDEYRQRKAAFDSFFTACAGRLRDAGRLKAQADRVLAEQAFWTGIGQLCHGRTDKGRELLRFATGLRSRLRFWPPLGRLAETKELRSRILSALRALLANVVRRGVAS